MPEQFSNDLLLLEKLAQGGMAEVYRAKQVGVGGFQKNVAVKRILPECAKVEEFKKMFLRETNLAAVLQHPNIIQVFSTGERDGYLYLVMEFLDGKTLQDVFDLLSAAQASIPVEICCFIVAEAAKGLSYAHNARDPKTGDALSVVHRDISPHNIMVSYDGSVKVVDFGIAKAKNSSDLTQAGIIKGKEGYLAPELVRGAEADRRSDLFALGVVLYEMLSGEFLFDGETTLETLKAIDRCEIPEILYKGAPLDPDLDCILRTALAKDLDQRYQSCDQFARELTIYLNKKYPGFTSGDLADFMYALFKEKIEQERRLRESQDVQIPENAWEEMGATAMIDLPPEFRKFAGGATGTIIIQQQVAAPAPVEEKKEPETLRSRVKRTAIWSAVSLAASAVLYFSSAFLFEAVFSKSPADYWSLLEGAQGTFDPKVFSLKAAIAPVVGMFVFVLLNLSIVGLVFGGILGSRAKVLELFFSLLSYITFLFLALLGFNAIALLQKVESTLLWFILTLKLSIEQIVQIVHLSPLVSVFKTQVGDKSLKDFVAAKLESAKILVESSADSSELLKAGREGAKKAAESFLDSDMAAEILARVSSHALLNETFLGLFTFGYLLVLSNLISRSFLFKEKRRALFRFYFLAFQAIVFCVAVSTASLSGSSSISLPLVGFVSLSSGAFSSLVLNWIVLLLSALFLQVFVGAEVEGD